MTTGGLGWLCGTAAAVGAVHTLLAPDHYVPFVAMARAGRWSLRRTLAITLACGVGHVLSSVLLGLVGIGLGIAVFQLERIEAIRGDLAGWLLLAFGVVYMAWGLRRAVRRRRHEHWHSHADGTVHKHSHVHVADHAHVHAPPVGAHPREAVSLTPWVLFTIFVFGPCEPLIPMVMYPAAAGSVFGVVLVTVVFGMATLAVMTGIVAAAFLGVGSARWGRYERFSHALAGFAIAVCGAAMQFGL